MRGVKRKAGGNLRGDAIASGANSTSNMIGHLNVDLSTLPDKTLLSVGADLGRSRAGQQQTQINQAIGQTFGRMNDRITNPMVLRDLWNGNVTLDLGEIHAIAEEDSAELEHSSHYWLARLRQVNEYKDQVNSHMLDGVPVSTLKSMYETATGTSPDKDDNAMRPYQPDDNQRQKDFARNKRDPYGRDPTHSQGGSGGDGGPAFRREPFHADMDDVGDEKEREHKDDGGEHKMSDKEMNNQMVEDMMTSYGRRSKYSDELLPFLPIVGANVLSDTRNEKHQKGLNEALFSNVIRDIDTGDPNINPLAMGLRIQDAIRFNGDNQILDSVFPGGSLNIGAIPSTTERMMIDPAVLGDYMKRCVSKRNLKHRFTAVDDYKRGQVELAKNAMNVQMHDIQWTNANKSASDFQHSSDAYNTMPMPVDSWMYRRQIDGVVPLQDNLLPAQALFVSRQPFGGDNPVAYPMHASARRSITYNPPTRFGWNPGVPFQ